jgi:excinuclease ABC subunit A
VVDKIIIKGAREHNLKNINLELPRDKLIVVSGKSGSGKSSLAFETIFAEGQRRYVESLSAYARQFLGRMDKPDLDYIEGLSPAISIEQKTTHKNPRSTVGTVTEIYDYYRLLFARIGQAYCPQCGEPIERQTHDQIVDSVLRLGEGAKAMILSPVVKGKKGEHQKILSDAKRLGYLKARVNGEIRDLDEEIKLNKKQKHNIDILVGRLVIREEERLHLSETIEQALNLSEGQFLLVQKTTDGEVEHFYSEHAYCAKCDFAMPELEPRLFSFNNPFGACPHCSGLGMTLEFEPSLVIPDPSKSFNQGGIAPYNPDANWHRSWFEALARHYQFSLDTPLAKLPKKVLDALMYGTKEPVNVVYQNREGTGKFEYSSQFRGILADLMRRYKETTSDGIKEWLEKYMDQKPCSHCQGKRLRDEALAVKIANHNIHQVTQMTVAESLEFFQSLRLNESQSFIANQVMKEITNRLKFLLSVGLGYLTLERKAATLSGGEAQRIRLATQIGSSLTGVLYILDEPTIGLHQRDNQRLIDTLMHLRDLGNTLIVVEHDEQTLRTADYIVDLGPGSGIHGGHVVAEGSLQDIMANPNSVTGPFLTGKDGVPNRKVYRPGNGHTISVRGARQHNLKGIDVDIPLGTMTVIAGVSGSGKSTLLEEIIYPALLNRLGRSVVKEGEYDSISGLEHVDKVINIDQSPIGRTPRSNPATYVGLFTPIRELFANLPESKARGYKPGRFSFNVRGGRCENCQGDGSIKIEMHFLPDVYVQCDVCKGKRFNRETLEIHYKGKSIHNILEMSIEEASAFFSAVPKIKRKLDTLNSVGLGYIKLGQSALTLSGGEAQRVKLSLELSKRSTGQTIYIIDEPTTGLHFADVKQLLEVLQVLVDKGNTIVLIEHNLDVIKQADHIIELGPEGGRDGGNVVVKGTPQEVAQHKGSHTGHFLAEVLQE